MKTARFELHSGTTSPLRHIDPRVSIAVTALVGLSVWNLPKIAVVILTVVAGIFAIVAGAGRSGSRRTWILGGSFLVFWVGTKFIFDWWNHPDAIGEAASEALWMGIRLALLLLLGMILSLITTPRGLGLAFSWFLKPVMRNDAWKAGLALALMLSFIPRTFRTLAALKRSLDMRCPHLSFYRRMFLLGLAVLRVLALQSWGVAMAVASRNLYRAEPWEYPRQPRKDSNRP